MPTVFQSRVLGRENWHVLAGTDLAQVLPYLPADSRVVTVSTEDEGVVGTWAGIRYTHMEGLWIAETHRKRGRVGALLLAGMREIARAWDAKAVLTGSMTAEVRELILRHGGEQLPGEHFVMPVERPRCR